jgi:hypothetical protein
MHWQAARAKAGQVGRGAADAAASVGEGAAEQARQARGAAQSASGAAGKAYGTAKDAAASGAEQAQQKAEDAASAATAVGEAAKRRTGESQCLPCMPWVREMGGTEIRRLNLCGRRWIYLFVCRCSGAIGSPRRQLPGVWCRLAPVCTSGWWFHAVPGRSENEDTKMSTKGLVVTVAAAASRRGIRGHEGRV